MAGKVTLVGAGPGDLGLLTLKGYEAIKNAETVVYDRLVGRDILKLIPEAAEKIDAGKEGGKHKIPQQKINELLLEKALEGKNVVRLKGGDGFLFGRGGEELELLCKNGIEFSVVPGITSALAVPAYGGIPVTHRDFVSSVHIIAGHQKKNEPLKINFKSCVECGGTLVFLMGVENIEKIMTGLIENGMNKDMPCCVIEQGTTPAQRKITGGIAEISGLCRENNIKSPSIIIVGRVCQLGNGFDWFDRLPLKGKSVVVTRPKSRAGALSDRLKELGANVIEYPCIETTSLLDDNSTALVLEKIKTFEVVAFTSPEGVKSVFDSLIRNKKDGRVFAGKKLAVIGSATGKELKKYGLFADYIPETYDGKSLGELITEKSKGKSVLLLRAKEGSGEIISRLKYAGIYYEDIPVYKTEYTAQLNTELEEKIEKGSIDYVTFTSASTVRAFFSAMRCESLPFIGLCIGEKTNEEAKKYGINTIVSAAATIDDMIEALVKEAGKCL